MRRFSWMGLGRWFVLSARDNLVKYGLAKIAQTLTFRQPVSKSLTGFGEFTEPGFQRTTSLLDNVVLKRFRAGPTDDGFGHYCRTPIFYIQLAGNAAEKFPPAGGMGDWKFLPASSYFDIKMRCLLFKRRHRRRGVGISKVADNTPLMRKSADEDSAVAGR